MNSVLNLFPLSIQFCILEFFNLFKNQFNNVIIELKWNHFILFPYSIIPRKYSKELLKYLKKNKKPTTQKLKINTIKFDIETINVIRSVIPYLYKKTKLLIKSMI